MRDEIHEVLLNLLELERESLYLWLGGKGLTEPPRDEEWEKASEVHLMNNKLSELPKSPDCPQLRALLHLLLSLINSILKIQFLFLYSVTIGEEHIKELLCDMCSSDKTQRGKLNNRFVAGVASQRPTYPSSKTKMVDWDKLEAQVKKEEKEEKLDGDAALNRFFRDIYPDADEDTRMAMQKSFVRLQNRRQCCGQTGRKFDRRRLREALLMAWRIGNGSTEFSPLNCVKYFKYAILLFCSIDMILGFFFLLIA
ncbi:unnamed protein product, partial [Vitis vinifera]|uniref:SGS domain-containing protein n=1 Tax=Vitis vinifera TaxID=29760 RepID=D7TGN9_VITVI